MQDRRVCFLRHGQSTWNAYHTEGPDPPLTDEGQEQAKRVVGRFDYVLISPMLRAQETFGLSGIHAPVREVNSLAREDCTNEMSCNRMALEQGFIESEADFEDRMACLRARILMLAVQYGTVLVVTHEGVINALTGVRARNAEMIMISLRDLVRRTPAKRRHRKHAHTH
jgi:broad specificity phosphatase PhoE